MCRCDGIGPPSDSLGDSSGTFCNLSLGLPLAHDLLQLAGATADAYSTFSGGLSWERQRNPVPRRRQLLTVGNCIGRPAACRHRRAAEAPFRRNPSVAGVVVCRAQWPVVSRVMYAVWCPVTRKRAVA